MKRPSLRISSSLICWMVLVPMPILAQTQRDARELNARSGLPHVADLIRQHKPVRVAYFGGSITAQDGWRSFSSQWLAKQYPGSAFEQIDASLSGTGSMLGAFRLDHDVLEHHPDLIFVEFATNDQGVPASSIARSVEGIVLEARRRYPEVDLCLIYTLNEADLPALEAGRDTPASAAMESVADFYGVPSINFGVSVAALVKADQLVFEGPLTAAAEGTKAVFSPDGAHPYPQTGHRIYEAAMERSLPVLLTAGPAPHVRKTVLDPLNLASASVIAVDDVDRHGSWAVGAPVDDSGQMERSLSRVWQASSKGDAVSFVFEGTLCGIYGVKGGDAARFKVSIDDAPPLFATLFDPFSTAGRYRIRPWFSPFLPPGRHTVRIEIVGPEPNKEAILRRANPSLPASPDYDKSVLYIGGLLVNGSLVQPSPRR